MLKNKSGYCPKCGGIWDVLADGMEFMSEDYIKAHHKCGCGAEWDEYYYAQYTGYAHNGVDYDDAGFTEEENKAMSKCEVEFASFCTSSNCDSCEYINSLDCRVAYFNDHYIAPDIKEAE